MLGTLRLTYRRAAQTHRVLRPHQSLDCEYERTIVIHMRIYKLIIACLLLTAVATLLTTARANNPSLELIMVESDFCPFCERFHAEIGNVYPNTDEGKQAPLRTWQIETPFPESLTLMESVTFTPTFILLNDGIEVGRLTGYNGDEFFWYLLGDLLEKL